MEGFSLLQLSLKNLVGHNLQSLINKEMFQAASYFQSYIVWQFISRDYPKSWNLRKDFEIREGLAASFGG